MSDKDNIIHFPKRQEIPSRLQVMWGPGEDKKAKIHINFPTGQQVSLTPGMAFELANVLSSVAMAAWHYNKLNGLEEEELKKE